MLRIRVSGASVALGLVAGVLSLTGCGGDSPVTSSPTAAFTSQAQYYENLADWNGRYVECARSFGADASLAPQYAITNPVAPGRPTTESGLDAECVAKLGSQPTPPPPSKQLLRGWYALLVEQAQCLREHGFTVTDPPSRDEFVENYSVSSWYPLNDVSDAGQDLVKADAQCPQPDPVEAERVGEGT